MGLLTGLRHDIKLNNRHEGSYDASDRLQIRALRRAVCRLFGIQLAVAFHEAAINALHTPSHMFDLVVDKADGVRIISQGLPIDSLCSIDGELPENGRGFLIICSCSNCDINTYEDKIELHLRPL